MDVSAFPNFQPLLSALEEYATSTGFRFRLSDWGGVDTPTDFVLVDGDESAGSVVATYVARVRAGDELLVNELSRAAKISEQEGLRNVMVATCKELKLWPPSTSDRLESIAYSDTSEPLDAIAWALYNHEKCITENPLAHKRLCQTASFLMDFAHAIGTGERYTVTSKAGAGLLTDFLTRATEWTQQDTVARPGLRKLILNELREFSDPKLISSVEVWLDRHWEAVAVGSVALVAGMVIAAIAISRSDKR